MKKVLYSDIVLIFIYAIKGVYFILTILGHCAHFYLCTSELQNIVFQNMTYSKERKRMNAYPALVKMPFRVRLCPQHISN